MGGFKGCWERPTARAFVLHPLAQVSGRLLIPGASAQILLSTSPTCAPTSKGFALTHSVAKNATGGVSHKPVEDGAAPTLLNSAGSFPENTATFKATWRALC